MLKQEIETLVEKSLAESTPEDVFAAGVLAGLPGIGGVAASATAKTGASLVAKAGATKVATGFSAVSVGSMIGVLGGLAGLLAGIGGAWFGIRSSAKQSTSEQERRLHWLLFGWTLAISIVYTGVLLAAVFGGWWSRGVSFAVNASFIVALLGSIAWFMMVQRKLHETHGFPETLEPRPGHRKPVSRRHAAGQWHWHADRRLGLADRDVFHRRCVAGCHDFRNRAGVANRLALVSGSTT